MSSSLPALAAADGRYGCRMSQTAAAAGRHASRAVRGAGLVDRRPEAELHSEKSLQATFRAVRPALPASKLPDQLVELRQRVSVTATPATKVATRQAGPAAGCREVGVEPGPKPAKPAALAIQPQDRVRLGVKLERGGGRAEPGKSGMRAVGYPEQDVRGLADINPAGTVLYGVHARDRELGKPGCEQTSGHQPNYTPKSGMCQVVAVSNLKSRTYHRFCKSVPGWDLWESPSVPLAISFIPFDFSLRFF